MYTVSVVPRLTLPLLLLLMVTGCGGPAGPDAVYRAYLDALGSGDTEAAFGLLSRTARERLAEAEAAWRAGRAHPLAPETAPGPDGPEGPPGLALYHARVTGPAGVPILPPGASGLLESLREAGDEAWITVRTPLGPREVRLVREEDAGWRVDLPTGR